MKKLILFTLTTLLINPLFSQTWKTESGGNDFDGKYKLAYVQGVGEEFPYNEPLMAFIKWDNQEDYSFYIKDADFFFINEIFPTKTILKLKLNFFFLIDVG